MNILDYSHSRNPTWDNGNDIVSRAVRIQLDFRRCRKKCVDSKILVPWDYTVFLFLRTGKEEHSPLESIFNSLP